MIRRYYERNTRLFLLLGGSKRAATIHRALWAPGVKKRAEALETVHRLLAEQATRLSQTPLSVLDLGCGVGGSLFALLDHLPTDSRGIGVTISPLQASLAQAEARRRGAAARLDFIESDFLDLPPLPPVDFAFSIEAFVLTGDPDAYFRSVARVLRPGGVLVLIDDFLQPRTGAYSMSEQQQIDTFHAGWHASGLDTVLAARDRASRVGLALTQTRELTDWVRVDTWRDRMVSLSVKLGRRLGLNGPYWDSLYGGDALRRCIAARLTGYYCLVFEKTIHHD